MNRLSLASIICGLVLALSGCGLTDRSDEIVRIQIVALDDFDGMWTVIELNSDVVFADTLRSTRATVPPLVLGENVPRGEYHLRISVREGDEVADLALNTGNVRSVWFDIDRETGEITYRTYREIMVVEG